MAQPDPGPQTAGQTAAPSRLWNTEFLVMNAVMFLTFCNMALFFQLYEYLHTLPIAADWFGLLIGLFALTALILRPLISPALHPGNARRWILLSVLGVVAALLSYNLGQGLWSLAAVRVLHGALYVVLASAVTAGLVGSIDPRRSGQAFGITAVTTLLPFAVVPPLVVDLTARLGGFLNMLNLSALLMLLIPPLLLLVKAPARRQDTGQAQGRLRWPELRQNLGDRRISRLLLLSLLVYTAFTPVFFYVKTYGQGLGLANAGWFFTISTLVEIMVRLLLGRLFDRTSKPALLAGSLALLALAYVLLAIRPGPWAFLGLAALFGLGWGVALPILNALLFDYSPARFRALNANLGYEMFQGGFFLGPLLGGLALQAWSYPVLFMSCGALCLGGLTLTLRLARREQGEVRADHDAAGPKGGER